MRKRNALGLILAGSILAACTAEEPEGMRSPEGEPPAARERELFEDPSDIRAVPAPAYPARRVVQIDAREGVRVVRNELQVV